MGRLVRYNRGTPPSSTLDIYVNLRKREMEGGKEKGRKEGGDGRLHLTYKYSMKRTYKFVLEQT